MSHDKLVTKMFANPAVRTEYDALKDEFEIFDSLIKARHAAGLTQGDVATRMGTQTPAVARLESLKRGKPSPSLKTLKKYAEAVGCRLELRLIPIALIESV